MNNFDSVINFSSSHVIDTFRIYRLLRDLHSCLFFFWYSVICNFIFCTNHQRFVEVIISTIEVFFCNICYVFFEDMPLDMKTIYVCTSCQKNIFSSSFPVNVVSLPVLPTSSWDGSIEIYLILICHESDAVLSATSLCWTIVAKSFLTSLKLDAIS